ncbi:DUF1542 domain-containing protein, partial [Staphylococcus aureus]|nr:DUF1542 domain-containing protein [Staphylococcus aureus]
MHKTTSVNKLAFYSIVKDLVKAKEDAKQDVDKQVQALIDEIDQNPNLTD